MTGKVKSDKKQGMLRQLMGAGSVLLLILFLKNAQLTSEYLKKGLHLGVYRVMPSVFPYLILSGLMTGSGYADWLGRKLGASFFGRCFCRITGYSTGALTAILVGILCGFPVGAKCAAEMYQKGTVEKKEAERLASFLNFCGPPFVMGVVGSGIFSSPKIGIILFLSQTIAALLFGGLYGRKEGKAKNSGAILLRREEKITFSLLNDVMAASCIQMLKILGFISFFFVLVGVSKQYLQEFLAHIPHGELFLFGIFEISSGVSAITEKGASGVAAAALILGWSGFSVHMQVAGFMAESGLSMKGYFTAHLLCPPVTALLAVFLCRIFGIF